MISKNNEIIATDLEVAEKCSFCKMPLDEKESLINKYEQAKTSEKQLEKTIKRLQNKLEEYCKTIEFGPNNSDVANKIANDFVILNRKCIFLEENQIKINSENINLKTELKTVTSDLAYKTKEFEINNNQLSLKITNLETDLQNSVPKQDFDDINKKYYDLTIKYREILNNEQKLFKEHYNVTHLKKEVELLKNDKVYLHEELNKLKCANLVTLENSDLSKKLVESELKELSEKQRADHTNSLYELVKEQLGKSEERNKEIENQNKILIASNLKLQLSQQEYHDKLINCVSEDKYDTLQKKYSILKSEHETLKIKHDQIFNRNKMFENEISKKEILNCGYNTEYMGMKHLILDLQSTSDDKALIARLGTDLVMARLCESEARNKVDILNKEIQELKLVVKEKEQLLNEQREKLNETNATFTKKNK